MAHGKAYTSNLRVLDVVDTQAGSHTSCRIQLACRARVDAAPVVQTELLILWNEAICAGTERRRWQARDFALVGLDNERALNHSAMPAAVLRPPRIAITAAAIRIGFAVHAEVLRTEARQARVRAPSRTAPHCLTEALSSVGVAGTV